MFLYVLHSEPSYLIFPVLTMFCCFLFLLFHVDNVYNYVYVKLDFYITFLEGIFEDQEEELMLR